jgi:3-phosphoshikimate 1-carboxyvinyltransferase
MAYGSPDGPARRAVVEPVLRLKGRLRVPGDKSVSHRALMLGALCRGTTAVSHLLDSDDVRSTAGALSALGVEMAVEGTSARVQGRGGGALVAPSGPLDCGNSGTTMRLLAGLLAGQGVSATLVGDESLSGRPMGRILAPLVAMGYRAEARGQNGRPPLAIFGGDPPAGAFSWASPIASAQVKSGILLAGLRAGGEVRVAEPAPSRDHTERLLRYLGYAVASTPNYAVPDERPAEVVLAAPPAGFLPEARPVVVPGDISSAAFWLVACALTGSADVVLEAVSVNPTRTGLLEALAAAGVEVVVEAARELPGGEPVADLRVATRGSLRAFAVRGALVPRLIDEIPVLAVLALGAEGESVIADAAELRVKESDRLAATARLLRAAGAEVEEREDGLAVHGPHRPRAFEFDAEGDHRMAMAAAVAALLAEGPCAIEGADACAVSYRGFFDDLGRLTTGREGP